MTIAAINFWNFYYLLAVTASIPKPASQPLFLMVQSLQNHWPFDVWHLLLYIIYPCPTCWRSQLGPYVLGKLCTGCSLILVLPELGMLSQGSALHVSVRVDFILSVHPLVDGKGVLFWNKQPRWLKISWNDKKLLLFNNNIRWLRCSFF